MTRPSSPDGAAADRTGAFAIRRFEDGDLDAVIALWQACGLVVPYNDPEGDIAFCRASPNAALFVSEAGGTIAAAAMAGHDGHRGWLYDVAVDPARRGAELGRRMVAHAETWLASLGVRKANL